MRIKDIQLTADSTQALISARKQIKVLERAYKRYKLEQDDRPILSSPRLDGMPRGSNNSSGLERRYISLEKYQKRIEQEERRLEQAREKARQVIYTLPDILQDFCYWYYIEGMTMQNVAAWIDRDISTCWRYKRIIEPETA